MTIDFRNRTARALNVFTVRGHHRRLPRYVEVALHEPAVAILTSI